VTWVPTPTVLSRSRSATHRLRQALGQDEPQSSTTFPDPRRPPGGRTARRAGRGDPRGCPGPWSITWTRAAPGGQSDTGLGSDRDDRVRGREAERIRHEVQQDLLQPAPVRDHLDGSTDAFHGDPARSGQRAGERHRRSGDPGGVDPLELDRHRARFDPGQVEHVVDDRQDVVRGAARSARARGVADRATGRVSSGSR
jgi:hypothetical protein